MERIQALAVVMDHGGTIYFTGKGTITKHDTVVYDEKERKTSVTWYAVTIVPEETSSVAPQPETVPSTDDVSSVYSESPSEVREQDSGDGTLGAISLDL